MASKNDHRKVGNKELSLRLSHRQINSLKNYCELKGMTPNKLMRHLLKSYLEDYTDEKMGKEEIDKRQLNLFASPKPEDFEQLRIFS
jgi:hypothetical protein